MSNQQVERLTALLARVQRNRSAPRGDNGVARPQAAAAPVPTPGATPASAPRRAEPAAAAVPVPPSSVMAAPAPAPSRGRPAPTPLEMAFEGRVSQPVEQMTQPIDVSPLPVASSPRDGRVLAEPNTPEPSKPIVQVVSKQPPHAAASFGELLRRSLSLRPR